MAHIAVEGSEQAIERSLRWLRYERVKKGAGIGIDQIEQGIRLLVDQVMSEDSLYAPSLATLVTKQGEGSMEEVVSLLRSYHSALPRRYYPHIISSREMEVEHRISAASKGISQRQLLDASHDYIHRLLDLDLSQEREEGLKQYVEAFLNEECTKKRTDLRLPRVSDYLRREGLLLPVGNDNHALKGVIRQMLNFPTQRSERLQILNRGMTQAITALGCASLRSYDIVHPTVGELRVGQLPISVPDLLQSEREEGFYHVGGVKVTEVENLIPATITNPNGEKELEFKVGHGITMEQSKTKAIVMSILDTCLESEDRGFATDDEEFVPCHTNAVEATGFISHLKFPHYVTLQSKLDSMGKTKKEQADDEREM